MFYLTAAVAVVLLGSQPLWEPASRGYRAWRLTRQLRAPDDPSRHETADELVQLGPAATWWVARAARDPDAQVRARCCEILGRLVPQGDDAAAEALLAAAGDGDPSVRACAVRYLEPIAARPGTADAVESAKDRALAALGAALGDESPIVRQAAAWALATLGPKARPVIGDLERALDGPDRSFRPTVAYVLMRIDPDAERPRVVAVLSGLLADPAVRLEHWRLVSVLASAQGQDATAAMLITLLRGPDDGVRSQAFSDLIIHCRDATSFKSALVEQLEGPHVGLREDAAIELLRYEPGLTPRIIELLAEQMVDPQEGGYMPEYLVQQMREASPGSMAPLAKSLVERLDRARTPAARLNTIRSLWEIGPEARCAIPALLEQSRSDDLSIATRAVEALVKIDPKAAGPRIPAILDWTTSGRDPSVRLAAIGSLRDLGPAAKGAVPALLKLADEQDLAISAAAIEALSRIDPEAGAALKHAIEHGASRPPD